MHKEEKGMVDTQIITNVLNVDNDMWVYAMSEGNNAEETTLMNQEENENGSIKSILLLILDKPT